MMASIPSNMFTCNGQFCIDATTVMHHDRTEYHEDKITIPLSADVKCYYLIRGGLELNAGVNEQDVIDIIEAEGLSAMWVDSESDARAQAMEMCRWSPSFSESSSAWWSC